MDSALHNEDLLIRYLDDELTPEEKAELEQRLQTDETLRQQLNDLRMAVQAVKYYGISKKVGSIHKGMMQEIKGAQPKAKLVPLRRRFSYVMAAAASVLVVVIGLSLYFSSRVSADHLYEQAFVDFPVSPTRGANNLSQFERYYLEKDYNAIVSATRSLQMGAKDSLLVGLSYLHKGQEEQAIGFFQRLSAYPNELQQDGEFYLGLSYLKSSKYANALPLFEKIAANPSHLYHSRVSKDFLNDVRSLQSK